MKEFIGDVFIAPNGLRTLGEYKKYSFSSGFADRVKRIFGVDDDEKMVQLWMCDKDSGEGEDTEGWKGCANWSDHGHVIKFDTLPVSVFKDKKEGDDIEFITDVDGENVKVVLTLSQNKYRYRGCGDFDAVLRQLLR